MQTTNAPMTRTEAAQYLKIHPMTLYKLARRNKVSYCRVGSSMRFLKEDLDSFLMKTRVAALP